MLTDVLTETYEAVTRAVADRPEADLRRPTRTDWRVAELLYHQSLDAVRALAAFATPSEREPDVDAVTYWRSFHPEQGDGGAGHARFVRAAAAAFPEAAGVSAYWGLVGPATARAAAVADPAGRVETQDHVLAVPDLVSTLVVEATVHLLDLVVDLPGAAGPSAAALAETRRVLEGLEGGPLPREWSDEQAVLRATGREAGWRVLLG